MRCRTILPLLFTMAAAAAPVSAQQLSLTIRDGLVNLDATGASVGQILDAWSRVGGTTIVNGDRVTGGPVTLKLVNTPERQALETILRSAAGYMAVPRAASGTPGDSMFDRIMVLPTSTAPQTAARAPGVRPVPDNPFFRGRQSEDEGQDPSVADADPDQAQPPAFSFPNQGQPGSEQQQANPFAQGGMNQAPFGQVTNPAQFGQPAAAPTPFGQPAAAPTPFGQPAAGPQRLFGQPSAQPQPQQSPFGQVQPTAPNGQEQAPVMNPFAAAAANAAQQQQLQQLQQQQQQQQMFPNTPPAPGTFTIIGSPTPGVVAQPQQPTQPGQRPPPRER